MTTAGSRTDSNRRSGFLLTVSAVAALGGFLFGFDTASSPAPGAVRPRVL
jgi:hypothetical protein